MLANFEAEVADVLVRDPVRTERIQAIIDRIAMLLPSQGPITAFVFLNPLQALEEMPFDQGVLKGARLFDCDPYFKEEQFRKLIAHGRIREQDLDAVLQDDLGERATESIALMATRFEIHKALLLHPVRSGAQQELHWFIAETDALRKMRPEVPVHVRDPFVERTRRWVMRDLTDAKQSTETSSVSPGRSRPIIQELMDSFQFASIESWNKSTWEAFSLQALWRVCNNGVRRADLPESKPIGTKCHRDLLLDVVEEDCDRPVNELLIRFCAAFTDQGFADWALPNRDAGLYRCFLELHSHASGPVDRWRLGLRQEMLRLQKLQLRPIESILESLELLGIPEPEWERCVTKNLLALKGWAGLIYQMDVRSDRVPFPVPPGSLIEYLALRLILVRLSIQHLARRHCNYRGPLRELRRELQAQNMVQPPESHDSQTFLLFQVAQVLGWDPGRLQQLSDGEWNELLTAIVSFGGLERRRLLHLAYERRFRMRALDAIRVHTATPPTKIESPRFQAVFCIDTREESFRRHLEEVCPSAETFGAAGFFVVPMYYSGASDAHFSTLCPVVIRPQHWVVEEVVVPLEEEDRRRAMTRKTIGKASHGVHKGSRSAALGAMLTASFGVLASIPLVVRVLFPRMAAKIKRTANRFVEPPLVTRLHLERLTDKPGPDGDAIGFSVDEMANTCERMLRDIHLTSNFSRLVMFIGHGSFCLNNPHKSAYDCGACSGGAGGPNARALAAFLNDPRIRTILADRGIAIPSETFFLGGLHNTCDDSVKFFDLDLLPNRLRTDYLFARARLFETCKRNAHERCRRFQSAPLTLTLEQAHQHVEGRSEDLAQVRPEFGNATNAMCFVGRRARLRGLYLDRRCFMHSYDASTDDTEVTILGRILGAVVPVCEGINLQYFFSTVDSPGWGCGTKLPHNVTSLLGVMDGYVSDLRPGLPYQGVEIHEPLRLLFVIESTPEAMFKIMNRNAWVKNILWNGWAQLSLLDPNSNRILLFRNGEFHEYIPETTELPSASSSIDWYRGWRDHLGFAQIKETA